MVSNHFQQPAVSSLANTTQSTTSSATVITTSTLANVNGTQAVTQTTALISAHQHYFQRNFSPMAALSRSPSCSSSPSIMSTSTVRRAMNNAMNQNQHIQSLTSTSTHVRNNPIIYPSSNTLQVNPTATPFATPQLLDVNNHAFNNGPYLFKTPSNAFLQQQHTPLNNYRRTFTPHSSIKNNMNNTTMNALNVENPCDSIYEQKVPEYLLEYIWTEPVNFNNFLYE